jgi:hypothetical protein
MKMGFKIFYIRIDMKNILTILFLFLFLNGCTPLVKIENHPNESEIIYEAKKSVIATYAHRSQSKRSKFDPKDFKKKDLDLFDFRKLSLFKDGGKRPNSIYVCGQISVVKNKGATFYLPLKSLHPRNEFLRHRFIYLHGHGSCITARGDGTINGLYTYGDDLTCDGKYMPREINIRAELIGCPLKL